MIVTVIPLAKTDHVLLPCCAPMLVEVPIGPTALAMQAALIHGAVQLGVLRVLPPALGAYLRGPLLLIQESNLLKEGYLLTFAHIDMYLFCHLYLHPGWLLVGALSFLVLLAATQSALTALWLGTL